MYCLISNFANGNITESTSSLACSLALFQSNILKILSFLLQKKNSIGIRKVMQKLLKYLVSKYILHKLHLLKPCSEVHICMYIGYLQVKQVMTGVFFFPYSFLARDQHSFQCSGGGKFFKIGGNKNLFGNISKYFCDKVFCQNFSGVLFSLFYQFRHPYIYSSSFPESMQKVKIRAISVCPLMCVMLPLPCNRQGHGRV